MGFVSIYPHERLEDLQCGGLVILQNPALFCFGVDAVYLSDFACVSPGERVLDIGTGNGILPILLSHKTKAGHITGIEIQDPSADLAERSVRLNGLSERISIVRGDIRQWQAHLKPATFEVIVTNPPYTPYGGGILNTGQARAIARHEICCDLHALLQAADKLLVPNGRLYMVHRPQRLVDVICFCREHHLEPKRIQFIGTEPGRKSEPELMLIEARHGGNAMVKVNIGS